MKDKYVYLITLGIIFLIYQGLFVGENFELKENVSIVIFEKVNQTNDLLISFDQFTDVYKLDRQEVEIIGFLQFKLQGQVYVRSIVDDFGNSIEIHGIKEKYFRLFEKGKVSKKPFIIKGLFKRDYDKLVINVFSLKVTERDATIVPRVYSLEKNVTNVTNVNIGEFVSEEFGCVDGTALGECNSDGQYCRSSILEDGGGRC
tara:strand:+ start:5506 stop:6111 length:606 start_codon:yes stop_codon:yes gene_type:complete